MYIQIYNNQIKISCKDEFWCLKMTWKRVRETVTWTKDMWSKARTQGIYSGVHTRSTYLVIDATNIGKNSLSDNVYLEICICVDGRLRSFRKVENVCLNGFWNFLKIIKKWSSRYEITTKISLSVICKYVKLLLIPL